MDPKRFIPPTRASGNRDAKLIIIATEGEFTKKRYFEDLAFLFRRQNIYVKVLDRLDSASDPARVLVGLDKFRRDYSLRRNYNDVMSRAALTTSFKTISSRCFDIRRLAFRIQHFCRVQNLRAQQSIAALFQRPAGDQIHLAAKDFLQFLFHPDMIEQTPIALGRERNKRVNVAVRREIVPDRGTEQRELGHLPAFAEGSDFSRGDKLLYRRHV